MHGTNDMPPAEQFWFNAQVRAATAKFMNEQREQARDSATSAGVADPQQERELHQRQEDRANARESMQEAGMHAPSPDGQLQQLNELQQQREQSESIFSGDADGSDPKESPDAGDL